MDLTSIFPVAADLEITLPTGEPTGIVLQVVGKDSAEHRAVVKKIAAMQLSETKPSIDQLEAFSVELVVSCITGWSGVVFEGVEVPYSKAKAIELFSNPKIAFVLEQVEAYTSKRANFFRKGPASA